MLFRLVRKGLRGTKAKPEDGEHSLFAFLTNDPAPDEKPIHSKATPTMLLTKEEDRGAWLNAPKEEAPDLQKPVPKGTLKIVVRGDSKTDAGSD